MDEIEGRRWKEGERERGKQTKRKENIEAQNGHRAVHRREKSERARYRKTRTKKKKLKYGNRERKQWREKKKRKEKRKDVL